MTMSTKTENYCNNCQRNAKICNVKILKTFHYISKLYSNLISNPRGGSVALEAGES